MTHYGFEPPWTGRSFHYGSWRKGEELWDGTGYSWEWVPPPSNPLDWVLRELYLPPIIEMLNGEILTSLTARDISEPMRVEVR